MTTPSTILTIAGSDGSGGAGIQADIKTAAALGCYALSVITAITAQNTCEVQSTYPMTCECVTAQCRTLYSDIVIDAVKIGMLGSSAMTATAASLLRELPRPVPIVLDTILRSTSGSSLLATDARPVMKQELLPLVTLITPNLPEAAMLLGMESIPGAQEAVEEAAVALHRMGAHSVLVKGGHGSGPLSSDCLLHNGRITWFSADKIATRNTHGTGCTLSTAIASFLAGGAGMEEAVERAKKYATAAIKAAVAWEIGSGSGPLNHCQTPLGRRPIE